MILLTIFVGIIALGNLAFLVSVAFLAISAKKLVDKGVLPAMSEVTSAVKNMNRAVSNLDEKAEKIMEIGENTAQKVSKSVMSTSNMVRDTVTSPLIEISSLVAGISQAMRTWRKISAHQ